MEITKDIDPRGFLLNDNDTGVDHLGESTFAGAIADSIHHVDTPITIGLFARWGSGKSFLLRHIESILKRYEKQCAVDNGRKKRFPEGGSQCAYPKRAIKWTIVVVLFVAIIFGSVVLAVNPEAYMTLLGIDLPDSSFSASKNETLVLTTTATNDNMSSPPPEYLRNMKILGLVLIPVEILFVFLVGCCGNSWLSLEYYGSCRLLTYGTFTKLPVRGGRTDIVEDPGQLPAQVLKHIRPGDERLAMAAAEAEIFPRKYIFVDFKAWEYHGSDTLWAGIITNLMDAIEGEFGTITARMFRMLRIEKIPQNISKSEARTIYLDLAGKPSEKEVLDMMKQYGVVTGCQRQQGGPRGRVCWKVVYSSDGECRCAQECLAIEGVKYHESNPHTSRGKSQKTKPGKKSRSESRKKLLKNGVEMESLRKGHAPSEEEHDALDRLTLPPKTRCCGRFCSHFLKYPTKLLCMPRLIWWLLIILCSVLIPIIAYIIAEYLNLEVYKTYRIVPIFGQILLWLPAGIAVTAFLMKFVWAMCHSQRKRINEALDGTRTKMADQLGFMSKVKSEIDVVTRLIQCARFTHQTDYKIVITIDDLDRVPMKKIQSVLEAVGILLSSKSSPFICIVAVDPRIVVKCIEEEMGELLRKSKITGHEYLKKIINLPVCLPEITDDGKKRYIAGLIDQADHTVTYREEVEKSRNRPEEQEEMNTTAVDHAGPLVLPQQQNFHIKTGRPHSWAPRMESDFVDGQPIKLTLTTLPVEPSEKGDQRSDGITFSRNHANKRDKSTPVKEKTSDNPISHREFLFHCRKFMYHDEELHKHMQGNPRNIKRLFNVISLTACIINSFWKRQKRRDFIQSHVANDASHMIAGETDQIERTERFAEDLVRWILLTDQWPYRSSYVLQVIEDADQRTTAGLEREKIPEEWTIFEIFQNKVKEECEKGDPALLSLDADPDLFYSFITLLKDKNFTASRIKKLQKFTVNLDYSVRHTIAFERDLSCLSPYPRSGTKDNTEEALKIITVPDVAPRPPEVVTESRPEEVQSQSNELERRLSFPNVIVHA